MIDPNPYETSETLESGGAVGENGTPRTQRGIWFWLFVGCVLPLAFIGLATVGFVIWAFF